MAELFPGVEVARRFVAGDPRPVEVERGVDSGNLWLSNGDDVLPPLSEGDVRWLAGVLTAALDNWPKQG